MFSLTPIEGALWHLGVAAQTQFALKIFSNVVFTGVVVFFLMKKMHQIFASSSRNPDTTELTKHMFSYGFCVVMGLTLLRSISTVPFSPVDFADREWASYRFVSSSPEYSQLNNSTNGLHWYKVLHGATNGVSKFMSKVASEIFSDSSYQRSPDLMFKLLTSTASVNLDDPQVTASLDDFVSRCSDTQVGTVTDEAGSMGDLMDLDDPECMDRYRDLQAELKTWARNSMPGVLRKAQTANSDEIPPGLVGFTDSELIENKVISSALINYGKQKLANGKDEMNTNTRELGIKGKADHFWYLTQKITAGGGFSAMVGSMFTEDGNAEASINRNEARIIYNNLLNMIPSFKGYVKAFIALVFLFAGAGLCLGFTQPAVWWGKIVLMDMVYEPLSTLNYEISSMLLASSDIGWAFGHLSRDPMALMGAATIDSELVTFQTAYFLVQFVIASLFVVGIVKSGFALRSMSFAQGNSLMNVPGAGFVARGVGGGVKAIGSRIGSKFGA